jgi:hypothetical protein
MKSEIVKRYWILFALQLPVFHLAYAVFPGDGTLIIPSLIIWVLVSMTWFTISNQPMHKKWLHIPFAFLISVAGQLLSWISFLIRLIHG